MNLLNMLLLLRVKTNFSVEDVGVSGVVSAAVETVVFVAADGERPTLISARRLICAAANLTVSAFKRFSASARAACRILASAACSCLHLASSCCCQAPIFGAAAAACLDLVCLEGSSSNGVAAAPTGQRRPSCLLRSPLPRVVVGGFHEFNSVDSNIGTHFGFNSCFRDYSSLKNEYKTF